MLKNNMLLQDLKNDFVSKEKKVIGRVTYTQRNFGFLMTENDEEYFIPPVELKKVLPNDLVEALVKRGKDGKEFVEINKLIEKGSMEFIGKVRKIKNNLFLIPERINVMLFIMPESSLNEGDWIVAKLKKHPLENGKLAVKFDKFISSEKDDRLFWKLAIEKNKINIDNYEEEIIEENFVLSVNTRKDLRSKSFFTVDGYAKTPEQSKLEKRDRDDAICIEKNTSGYTLYVAISDVAEFVKEGTYIDDYALKNKTSYYLPEESIPMLPRKVSECYMSLNELVDRPVIVCEMEVSESGEVVDYKFYEAMINSKAQLSYTLVSEFMKNGVPECYKLLSRDIEMFAELGQSLNSWRKKHQNVQENRIEYKLVIKNYKLVDIIKVEDIDSAMYVAECMLSANMSFAKYMSDNNQEAIYNVFAGFSIEKSEDLNNLISLFDINLDGDSIFEFKGYNKLTKQLLVKDNYVTELFNAHLTKGRLSSVPEPHAGLGIETGYATFTSPLRKYVDLINHRKVKSLLRGEVSDKVDLEFLLKLKEQQLKQRSAENFIKSNLYYEYMSGKVGQNYTAKVIGIYSRGISIKLEDNGVMGFLPLSNINKTLSELMKITKTLVFTDGTNINLGDMLSVSLSYVNGEDRDIIFKLN